ncbi:MAG: hypothetical protein Kow00104_14730 [Rhodothalassiaceae bacterium]
MDGKAGILHGPDEDIAGVGNAGRAGIRNQCYGRTFAHALDEFLHDLPAAVLMKGHEWSRDAEMGEKPSAVTRILAGDDIGPSQGLEGAPGDIAKISDRSRNDMKTG